RVLNLHLGEAAISEFGGPTSYQIRLPKPEGGDAQANVVANQVKQLIETDYPGARIDAVETVSGKVSEELASDGAKAIIFAMIGIAIYIWFRFEWQFGVGAVVTLILDVTKTVGFFAITGLQFNLTSLAAILTIMGYSINDKVVVYDRVRENLRKYKSMPLRELIDLSINETLNRTINTSFTTFLATIALALIATGSVKEFAIVILFGIVIGTSSSIFIAAPILLFLGENRLRRGTKPPAVTDKKP
ncbi:MAG TPA: protein translocase subunit SecF, partial [Candidatus Polarisedimenticolia bacterium]|nr:protein translocase subunit SecF [Candidatus Polarisedimenticolia bacterium]